MSAHFLPGHWGQSNQRYKDHCPHGDDILVEEKDKKKKNEIYQTVISAMEINKEEREIGSGCEWERRVLLPLNWVAREGFSGKGTFQQRPEGG